MTEFLFGTGVQRLDQLRFDSNVQEVFGDFRRVIGLDELNCEEFEFVVVYREVLSETEGFGFRDEFEVFPDEFGLKHG